MIQIQVLDRSISLETHPHLFSPSGLDAGTRLMLEVAAPDLQGPLLDLGCGCGPVGIAAAKVLGEDQVWMTDIDPLAVEYSIKNAAANGVSGVTCLQSDGLDALLDQEIRFRCILSNPPYHADFGVPKKFIAQSVRKLAVGGRLYMVTKRRDWYENRIRAVFGGVKVYERDGYFVFEAEKRAAAPKKKEKGAGGLSKKLQKKYAGRKS